MQKAKTDIMLDLETWGVGSDAAIISIGAVRFDPRQGFNPDDPFANVEEWDKFHVAIDPETLNPHFHKTDAKTLMWWMHQDRRAALDEWLAMTKVSLFNALDGFAMWVEDRGRYAAPDVRIWGNGATFDNIVLGHAYKSADLRKPWAFRGDRDVRTIKDLADEHMPDIPSYGTLHNALIDSINQVLLVQAIYARKRL